MPKNKKKSDSTSDSDSGPDDKSPPPPPKKSKESKESNDGAAKKGKSSSGEPAKQGKSSSGESGKQWILEKYRQVRINEFRGRLSVDIREFYERDGEILPGKKGIALTPIQWRKLLEISDEITKALEES